MERFIGEIKINLPPIPLKRGRHDIYHSTKVFNSQVKEQKGIRWLIRSQYKDEPLKGPVGLVIYFGTPIPNNWSKKKRESYHQRWCDKTPDIDNLEKMYADCGNKILFDDDCQIVFKTTYHYYDLSPHTIIKVYLLDDFFAGRPLFLA